MPRRVSFRPSPSGRWASNGLLAACLLAFILTACGKTRSGPKSGDPFIDSATGHLHSASMQNDASKAGHGSGKHFILPNPALLGCKTANCTQLLPDQKADPDAIHPWQLLVDFNGNQVIGLIALYDQPTTIDDLQAAVDERYGQWAVADFRTGPVRIWRVEPPQKFVIQLAVADSGMIQLIYIAYGAKHPMSDQAAEYLYCSMEKSAKCVAHRRWTSWAPGFLR